MHKNSLIKQMKKHISIYLMILPVFVYLVIFSYTPLFMGIITSFKENRLIGATKFVGFDNYISVFQSSSYHKALVNTLIMGTGSLVITFFIGLVISLSLNELRVKFAKSAVQTVTFLPSLLSWTVVGGMWLSILSSNGLVNNILKLINPAYADRPFIFMSEESLAQPIMILTDSWKGSGFVVILFMAAIVSVDPSIFEAATIDGASRFRQIISVLVPNLIPTMKTVLVLGVMAILQPFDQIFVMGNRGIYSKVVTLLYMIYSDGILEFKMGTATAAATIVLLLTMLITFVVKRLSKYNNSFT